MLLIILAYLGGVLTILSPCILPVLPFVFSRADGPFLKNGLPLLAGMAITFALISTLAALGGGWAVQANEWGRWIAMILLVLFALTLLSPWLADRLSRPFVALGGRLTEAAGPTGGASGTKLWQSLLLGVATGLLWAPCAGPILGLILTAAALKGASAATTFLLLAYALGAATSLAVVLFAGQRALNLFKRSQAAEAWIRRGLGAVILVGVAVVALGLDRGVLTQLSGPQTTGLEQGLIAKLAPSLAKRQNAPVVAGAEMKDLGMMPSLAGGGPWFNSPPLTTAGLKGKVVVVDFWTYSCINCLRSIPYTEAWAKRYASQGLVVIGVHAPEFAFEKNAANVQKAIKDFGITYPVVMDNDRAIWTGFDNDSWPAHYFIDATGHIRHEHDGEGDYAESEQVIRTLLAMRNGTAVTGAPVDVKTAGVEAQSNFDDVSSPETYIGYKRSERLMSPGGIVKDQAKAYRLPAKFAADDWALGGTWTIAAEQATAVSPGAKVAFQFHARDLHMVLGPSKPGQAIHFRVLLDGKPPGDEHGVDVDAQGNGVVTSQRLYQLIRQKKVTNDRLFEIEFTDPGVQAFTFTFG